MQGKFESTSPKYYGVASILGKQIHHLLDANSYLGRWMASKNTIALINDHLFVHGGLHPDLATTEVSLSEINAINRANYYLPYFPTTEKNAAQLLLSNRTGVCWYRGYFREDLTQEQVDAPLDKFNARAVVVGHTIQSKVKRSFAGRVIGIDVSHPKDYHKNWPNKQSEGLLIKGGKYYRLLHDGEREEI